MLSAFSGRSGLDRETALRVAGAFGAGMARRGETCGAVTGALMVIGLRHGKTRPDDDEARERSYDLAGEFVERFQSRNGTVLCRDLLGVDVSTPEGMREVREKNLFATVCPQFVKDAAEIIEQIL